MLATLTEEDKETAARTSWQYYTQVVLAQNPDPPRRDRLARDMIQRHLVGAQDGCPHLATQSLHATLQGRRDEHLDWIRTAWNAPQDRHHWSPEQHDFSQVVRQKMKLWLGPHGRVCVMDYDEDHRCTFYHKLALHTTIATRYEPEAILYAASYMLEKALACSERRSTQQRGREQPQSRCNVVLDFRGANMKSRAQIVPLSIALEVVTLMRDHHPDRLWTITMIDAPLLARLAWPVFQPFCRDIVAGGIHFVTGSRQIRKVFGDKMAHYDRAGNLDLEKFFQLPFDQTYEDVHGEDALLH